MEDKIKMLQNIKKLYSEGGNIIEYLRNIENSNTNTVEDIMISYDFQTGNYIENHLSKSSEFDEYYSSIASIINQLKKETDVKTIMEAGVGEATALCSIINLLEHNKNYDYYGFDISWSRIKYAKEYVNKMCSNHTIQLFVGDLFSMPLKDNSIDIIYTKHSMEPNGGKEKEILKELYRAANKYLVLFEPIYELSSKEVQERMKKHGYVTKLYDTAKQLGYKVIQYELLKASHTPNNPTGVIVIEKNPEKASLISPICCPVSKKSLKEHTDSFFCEESLLAYPIIQGIPCLTERNAIIATKFNSSYF